MHSLFAEQLGASSSAHLSFSQGEEISVFVTREIEWQISERLQIPLEDISVQYLGLANVSSCSAPEQVLVNIPENERFRGSVIVSVTAYETGKICGQWNLRSKVAILEEVYVAKEDIPVNGDVVWKKKKMRRDLFQFSPAFDVENSISVVSIQAGDVILSSQIRRKPDRFRGDSVIVIYEKGALQIRTEGTLMTDAIIGQDVKVTSQATKSVLHGILSENGMVYIEGKK